MTAFVAVAGVCGTLGFLGGLWCAEKLIAEAHASRDRARNRELVARADAEHWRARCVPMFSTGRGSPWAPVIEGAEDAP